MENNSPIFYSTSDKIKNCITEAWKITIDFYSGDTLNHIQAWRLQVSGMTSLYSLFRTSDLADFATGIFHDQVIRDFVMKLSINFHARFEANETQEYSTAIELLASSIDQHPSFTVDGKQTCLIPEVLLNRLPVMDEISSALAGNKWLFTLVAMIIYISVDANKTAGAK